MGKEFVMTIEEDGDDDTFASSHSVQILNESSAGSDSEDDRDSSRRKQPVEFNKNFLFSSKDGDIMGDTIGKRVKSVWNFDQVKNMMNKNSIKNMRSSVDELLSRRLQEKEKKKQNALISDEEDVEEEVVFPEEEGDFVEGSDSSDIEAEQSAAEELESDDETKEGEEPEESKDSDASDESEDIEMEEDPENEGTVDMKMSDIESEDEKPEMKEKDRVMEKRKAEFFESPEETKQKDADLNDITFQHMNLSRPLTRAISDLGFVKPTRIQVMTIPVALQGKDICGAASTGSGKTAAFLLPVFERLLYRPKSTPATRVLVLTPTRELAAQCHSVALQLAKYTDITFALCVGGASNREQELELRKRPDIIIATPGRLIDHMQNSASFGLESVEILIMDEADRMLEEGFQAELTEIVRGCPRSRQTLLFSATMTDNVDQLIRLSLNRPVKLFIDPTQSVTQNLVQEFVRVRVSSSAAQGEHEKIEDLERLQREAIVLSLCLRTFKHRTIIFCPSKVQCHRLKILFSINKIKSAELHGNLTQLQRLESLEQFRDGHCEFLLATDLAARGLDIAGVETVINFQLPAQYDRYVHRVGRTARHFASGKAVTLVGEKERKMVKVILKNLKPGQVVKQRVIPSSIVQHVKQKIVKSQSMVEQILADEKEERTMEKAEMELQRAENMIKHEKEIFSRPARQWFQSEKERQVEKTKSKSISGPFRPEESDQENEDGLSSSSKLKKPKSIYEEEMKKELEKIKAKRPALAGLSRKQKRRKMMMGNIDKETKAKQDAIQKIAAKHIKRASRDGVPSSIAAKVAMSTNNTGKKKKQKNSLSRGFDNEKPSTKVKPGKPTAGKSPFKKTNKTTKGKK